MRFCLSLRVNLAAVPATDLWGLLGPGLLGPLCSGKTSGPASSALWCARCHKAPSVMGQAAKLTSLHHGQSQRRRVRLGMLTTALDSWCVNADVEPDHSKRWF